MASDLNIVMLVGRLTRDAELRVSQNGGYTTLHFSLAVNRRKKNGDEWTDEASFIDCTLFGAQGESLVRNMPKGRQVAVVGELRQRKWTDSKDGSTREKIEVAVNRVQLFWNGEQSAPAQGQGYQRQAAPAVPPTPAPSENSFDFDDVPLPDSGSFNDPIPY